jgi:S-adenosylmethionine decarboxylase proenzyme
MEINKPVGMHILIDGSGCQATSALLNDRRALVELLEAAAQACGALVLETVSRTFEPQGVTVFCVLSESHISIHTYPEHGVYMADVFTCGDAVPQTAADMIVNALGGTARVTTQARGSLLVIEQTAQ